MSISAGREEAEELGRRRLNVAIIGCGAVGQREAAAVSAIPDLRLVAISDFGPAFRHLALQMGWQSRTPTGATS